MAHTQGFIGLTFVAASLSLSIAAGQAQTFQPKYPLLNNGGKTASKDNPNGGKPVKNSTTLSPGTLKLIQSTGQQRQAQPSYASPTLLISPKTKTINPASLRTLQSLGAKAKSGSATQSELDELMRLCNQASDYSAKNSGSNKGSNSSSSSAKDIDKWDNDFSTKNNEKWNTKSTKKGGGSISANLTEMSGSLGGSGSSTSSNKGEKSSSQTNKQKGNSDNSTKSSGSSSSESSYENEQTRIAKKECDAVLALMGTKDTNKTTIETTRMEIEDKKAQREHELRLMQMKLDEERKARDSQQQNQWMQMGGSILNNLFAPKSQSGSSPSDAQNAELMETIKRQQEQIEQLLQMQQSKPESQSLEAPSGSQ